MKFRKSSIIWLLIFMGFSAVFAEKNKRTNAFFTGDELIKYERFALRDISPSDVPVSLSTETSAVLQPKSKGKAFLFSFILPGLGERYVGADRKATVFMATELTLWLSYAGFKTYRDWRKEDYKTYAATHAGVDLDGKSDSYFVDVGNYDTIYDYNAAKLRQRNLADYYRDIEANFWQWESQQHREKFDQLRISADRADNRSLFVIGAIFANHILSAIDAVWSAHRYEKIREKALEVRFGDGVGSSAVLLTATIRF